MDLARPRPTEWIAGLAGVVLVVSLFLPWYEGGGESASGWASLTVIDLFLAIAGLMGIAVVALAAARRSDATLIAFTAVTTTFCLIAALLALLRLAAPADDAVGGEGARMIGVFLATGAALVLLIGIGLSLRNDRPRALRGRGLPEGPEIRDLGVPQPAEGSAGSPAAS